MHNLVEERIFVMNSLIIFDIDGTLINYISAEDEAYLNAINEVVNIKGINRNWDEYNYSTESGILSEIFYNHLGRHPSLKEESLIKTKYVSSLRKSLCETPNSCIAGAKEIFQKIKNLNWDIAIATGAWLESAKEKLSGSNIPEFNVPIAHGGDHPERKEIIIKAINRAKDFYNKDYYHKIIYVGDRPWDIKAALALNIDFIGVGQYLGTINPKDFFHVEHYETPDFLNYIKEITNLVISY